MAKRRRKVLGIPIGPPQPRFSPAAKASMVGGAGAAALAAVPVARRVGHAAGRGRELAGQGRELAGQAGRAARTLHDIEERVSSHSSTLGKVGALAGAALGTGHGGKDKPKLSHLIEEHTDIAASRSTVYNQWTQMEMFPGLTKAAESVSQNEDDQVEWTAKIGPSRRQWTARITRQIPDELIAWHSEGGLEMEGVVSFHRLDEDLTRVLVEIHYRPHGPVETVGNKLRIQRRRVRRDLRLFKHFMELEGEETGAWRGSIGNGADRPRGGDDGDSDAQDDRGARNREEPDSGEDQDSGDERDTGTRRGGADRKGDDGEQSGEQAPAARRRTESRPAQSRPRSSSTGSDAKGSNGRSTPSRSTQSGSAGSNGRSSDGRSSNGRSSNGRSSNGRTPASSRASTNGRSSR